MTITWRVTFTLLIATILFGCGGGGGGGDGARITTEIFTDWSSVEPPVKVALTGLSQDTVYEVVDGDPGFDITIDEFNTANVATTITYRADGSIERIDIATPRIALSWDETAGDIISNNGPFVYAGDLNVSKFGVVYNPLDPAADPWEYQTFGAWADARPLGAGAVGALSFGTPTSDSVLIDLANLNKTATFKGHSAGIYTTGDGTTAYLTESAVEVNVDFLARELAFRTSGTTLTNLETGDPWTNGLPPSLDISTNPSEPLRYVSGVNLFTGDVSTAGGVMTGQTKGQFYGPAAHELGGVFSLTGPDGLEHYSGAYGAAQ